MLRVGAYHAVKWRQTGPAVGDVSELRVPVPNTYWSGAGPGGTINCWVIYNLFVYELLLVRVASRGFPHTLSTC